MAKDKDLDEFGFEPIEQEDLSEFGFEPSETMMSEETSSEEKGSTLSPALKQALGIGAGATIGKGVEKVSQKAGEGLTSLAEDLAYRAIGGENTPSGRKFLKDELAQLGNVGKGKKIDTKSLGRRALDEGYADVFKRSGTAFDAAETNMLKSIGDKNKILESIKTPVDVEEIGTRMYKQIAPELDFTLGGEYDEKTLKELQKEMDYLQGESRSLSDLERAKVKTHEMTKFDPGTEPISKSKQKVLKAKGRALKEAVEEGVAKRGSDVSEAFLDAKRATGERGIIRDILMDKTFRDRVSPEISLRDIGMTGVAGPAAAGASKAIQKKGASVGAKLSDLMGKIAKSKATKALPYIGAAIGALGTYSEAKAAGEPTGEAIKQAIAEEGVEAVLGPAAGIILPERSGPRKDSLEYKLESGQKLTPEEYKKLFPQAASSLQESDSPAAQALGDELEKAKEQGGDTYNQKMYQIQQQPALRELLRRRAKVNLGEEARMSQEQNTEASEGNMSQGEPARVPAAIQNTDEALRHVLDLEAGYQAQEEDEGNYLNGQLIGTNHGITPAAYQAYYGEVPTAEDMKNLTQDQALEIYKADYVDRPKLDLIQDPNLQAAVLDFGVNSGTTKAIRFLQELVGVDPDGLMGPETVSAIENYDGDITQDYLNKRREFIDDISQDPSKQMYQKGWQNRIDKLESTIKEPEITEDTPMIADSDLEEVDNLIDRVNQQQSSGDMVPMNQLDQLLEIIDKLKVPQDTKDELETEATNMVGYRDGQRLKDMLRKLRS